MEKINLPNRYGDDVYLQNIPHSGGMTHSLYKLICNSTYIGFGFDIESGISSVDPPGGPYLCLGDCIDGMIIDSIYTHDKDIYIVFYNKDLMEKLDDNRTILVNNA